MAHTFHVELTESLLTVLSKIESEIRGNGGVFTGDENEGCFSGHSPLGPIKGEYDRITDQEIRITITDKPFLVPYSLIESEIRGYFEA